MPPFCRTWAEFEIAKLTTDQLHEWHVALSKQSPRLRTEKGEKQNHKVRDKGADADEWRRKRRASANRTLTILRAALNRAWRDGKVASNGAWARVEPFDAVDAAQIRYLTVAEAQQLVNACDPDFRLLVQAVLQTGCRYGELTQLKVHDFNPDTGTLAIWISKSGKPRHVVLTEEGAAFFQFAGAGRAGNETMFVKASGQAWGKSHQRRPMAEACRRAKISSSMGFHGLRHTWASLAVMNDTPLIVVAKNIGHADTRMVEKHYGHLAPSYVADGIRKGTATVLASRMTAKLPCSATGRGSCRFVHRHVGERSRIDDGKRVEQQMARAKLCRLVASHNYWDARSRRLPRGGGRWLMPEENWCWTPPILEGGHRRVQGKPRRGALGYINPHVINRDVGGSRTALRCFSSLPPGKSRT